MLTNRSILLLQVNKTYCACTVEYYLKQASKQTNPISGCSMTNLKNIQNLTCSTRDTCIVGSIPGLERSPGVGNGNPLQYSCLENSMDRGVQWAKVHVVPKTHRTQLKQPSISTHMPAQWRIIKNKYYVTLQYDKSQKHYAK